MKTIVVFIFITFSSIAHASCHKKSSIQYAQNFYQNHYYFFEDTSPQNIKQLYTIEFGNVIRNHIACINDDSHCNLNFDPWLDAQDGYVDYSTRSLDQGKVLVELKYQFRVHSTHPSKQQTVSLVLNKVEAPLCWKVDDLLIAGSNSIKKMMFEDYQNFYYYNKPTLAWSLISSAFDTSKIQVNRDGQAVAEYVLNCDVSESIDPDPEILIGEMNRVGLLVTPSQPKGLLITSCRVGAHSKRLSVYNLESKVKEPIWEETGSYFAEWSINKNYELLLSYDRPCEKTNCIESFTTENIIFQNSK